LATCDERLNFDTLREPIAAEGAVPAERVLAVGRQVGPSRDDKQRDDSARRRQALGWLITQLMAHWAHQDLKAAMELERLGHPLGGDLSSWLVQHATPADAPALATHLAHARSPNVLAEWLQKQSRNESILEPLKVWFDARVAAKNLDDTLLWVAQILASLGTEAADRYLVEVTLRIPGLVGTSLIDRLIAREQPPADPALVAFLRDSAGEGSERSVRCLVATHLLLRGGRDAVPLLPAAYRRGMAEYSPPMWARQGLVAHNVASSTRRPLVWLAVLNTSNPARLTPLTELAPADVARAFDLCLATGLMEPWYDTRDAISLSNRKEWDLPEPALEVICKRALDCPDPKLINNLIIHLLGPLSEQCVEASRALALRCFEHADPEIRRRALEAIQVPAVSPAVREKVIVLLGDPDESVVQKAMEVLTSALEPNAVELFTPLLSHPHPGVRSRAVTSLSYLNRPGTIDLILPLLENEKQWFVRQAACEAAGVLQDRRAVQGLLSALRDRNEPVRKAAKKALDAIQFYVDQTERWERILKHSSIQAPNAAEALLAQAKNDQPKNIRLAAIASLGTLGLPETLPVLIAMMQDQDPQIAQSAAAAVEKINSGARK
jgi:HEAT repeat protein